MELSEILNKKVSYQKNTWSEISKEQYIIDVLNEIKSNKYKIEIDILRNYLESENDELYGIHKKRLPAITFCGTFNINRQKEFLKDYTQLIVLDIDKLDSSEFERIKSVLKEDEYTFTFWTSPSNTGIKGLVYLSYEFDLSTNDIDNCHNNAFNKLKIYFQENYNIILDNSGSDTTRLCYLSHDLNLILKDRVKPFTINEHDIKEVKYSTKNTSLKKIKNINSKDALHNSLNKNKNYHRFNIQLIIRFLSKRKLSITNTYEDWYRVGYAISATFTFDIGLKYFLRLCELDGIKHNEKESHNLLISCYENNDGRISFKSVEYLAKQKGYINKNKIGEDVVSE